MHVITILVQPGTVKQSAFLSKINDPVDENTLLSLVSSVATLIVLYVLKVIIIIHYVVIGTVEDDITYWKLDIPLWVQVIFTMITTFYIINIGYLYKKYKQ